MIGKIIREFEIQSELGSGGYGVVYRAHDQSVDRDVAIKVILPQYASKPEFIANFDAEARLVAQLEHINIVPLYSYWRDEQGAFLVMRYIRGGSLRGMIAKQGALPLTRIMRIVEQIADALNAAHEAGVVHRDLKPDNVLIDERGNAYLTDFGIAKQLSEDNASATDAIKGTFAYLSPEQIQQTQVSPQTDVYALGVMLFEMLAGQHPFHETPVGMMVMKHLQEPLPDVRDWRDDLSSEMNRIIHKATAKDPAERYASTLELVADLKTAISGVSVTAPQSITPVKKKPTTTEERNRYAMLENVRKFWVEGVLENSLHDAARIDLGMKSESGAVDNPWDTLLRTPGGDETVTHDTPIIEIFDRMNGKLLILGDPGSGKTTTLLTLARELLYRAEIDDQHPIPVVFNLSSWSENQAPLTEWLVEELNGKYQVPRKVATQWIEDDELLLLLDGLDEVAEDARSACVQAINAYRSEHGFVDVVVCSRITDYESLSNQLKLNGAIVIQPLDDAQIVQYLDALGADVAVVRELITRDVQLRELAHSPLMLSIMVLAYRGKTASEIPDFDNVHSQRQHLFDVYVERMFDRRVGDTPYTKAETKHYLRWLAHQMQKQVKTVFHIEELQPSVLLPDIRKRYNFLLRLIVFALTFISLTVGYGLIASVLPLNIPLFITMSLVPISLIGVLYSLERRIWKAIWPHILIGFLGAIAWTVSAKPTDSITLLFVAGVGFSNTGFATLVVAYIHDQMRSDFFHINTKESIKISVKEIKPFFLFGVLLSSVIPTLIVAHWVNPTGGWGNWLLGSWLAGLGYSALIMVATSFVSSDIALRVTPNQGIQQSLQTGLRVTVALGTLFVIAFLLGAPATTARTALGLSFGYGFSFAWAIFSAYGGMVYIAHVLLRAMLRHRGHLPGDLVRFLDYTAALILMRKVGGGYIFIHRYLLEYFAGLETDSSAGN